jgi:flotillin
MRTKAEAAGANNRVALDLKWIEIMPELVDKMSDALAESNLTVLNGAEGLGEVMTGFIAQAMAVYNAARGTTAEAKLLEAQSEPDPSEAAPAGANGNPSQAGSTRT